MRATQVLVAVIAQSVAEIEDVVTLPQFRVLVMVATRAAGEISDAENSPLGWIR